jgi:hypothetical protein
MMGSSLLNISTKRVLMLYPTFSLAKGDNSDDVVMEEENQGNVRL